MANLQVRDTVFCRFIGTESNLLEIFNAIRKTRYTDASKVMITTLAGSFYSNIKNNISFMLDALIMMLIEHHITLNPNMPVRLLGYVNELFKRYIEPEKRKIYSIELIKLPAPEFMFFMMVRIPALSARNSGLARHSRHLLTSWNWLFMSTTWQPARMKI